MDAGRRLHRHMGIRPENSYTVWLHHLSRLIDMNGFVCGARSRVIIYAVLMSTLCASHGTCYEAFLLRIRNKFAYIVAVAFFGA